MPAISHALAILIALMVSLPASAQVQNLDQDKNGPKLFATTCADCHRSARGLAKGRFSLTLWYYLQQHYTSSSATARTLTAYLQSVDTPPRSKTGKSQPQPTKSRPTKSAATSASALRPAATVPGR
jgi:mono/diheme cytochrome c family protein